MAPARMASSSDEIDEDDFLAEAQLTSKHFHGFDREELKILVGSFSITSISKGDVIVQQGEIGTWSGLLLSGELQVSINGELLAGAISAGQCVGEMAVFMNGRRNATIHAASSGRIATMLIRDLQRLIEERPTIGAKLVSAFTRSAMETLIIFKIQRWIPPPELALKDGKAEVLDEWMAHLRSKELGFANAEPDALKLFEVLTFTEGCKIVQKKGSLVFQSVLVVLSGKVECSWPSASRVVERHGMIGEHLCFLNDVSLQTLAVTALSSGTVAVLSGKNFSQLRSEFPAFHAALVYLMAAESVLQLSVLGVSGDSAASEAPSRQARVTTRPDELARGENAKMEIFYQSKMVAGKKEAAAIGEAAKDSAAKLEKTAHSLRRYKVLALKYERERDNLQLQIEDMEADMKQVKNLRRELANTKEEYRVLEEEFNQMRSTVDTSSVEYLRERLDEQVKELDSWRKASQQAHAQREIDKQKLCELVDELTLARGQNSTLSAQAEMLESTRDAQIGVNKMRDEALRQLTSRIAMCDSQLRATRDECEHAMQALRASEDALAICSEENKELADKLRLSADQRLSTRARRSMHKAHNMAAAARRASALGAHAQHSALANARDLAIEDLVRCNTELAEALQEQSGALWVARQQVAHAQRTAHSSVDARESASYYAFMRAAGRIDLLKPGATAAVPKASVGADVDPARKTKPGETRPGPFGRRAAEGVAGGRQSHSERVVGTIASIAREHASLKSLLANSGAQATITLLVIDNALQKIRSIVLGANLEHESGGSSSSSSSSSGGSRTDPALPREQSLQPPVSSMRQARARPIIGPPKAPRVGAGVVFTRGACSFDGYQSVSTGDLDRTVVLSRRPEARLL